MFNRNYTYRKIFFFGYFSAIKFLEKNGFFVNIFIDIEIFINR